MMQNTFYYVTDFNWAIGERISHHYFANSPHKSFFTQPIPPKWAATPDYCARRIAEEQLETARRATWPDHPSRRDALFLNASIADARRWVSRPARASGTIYEMRPIDCVAACQANYVWFNYLVRLHKNATGEHRGFFAGDAAGEVARCVEAYWANQRIEPFGHPSQVEVLYLGTLEVVRVVT